MLQTFSLCGFVCLGGSKSVTSLLNGHEPEAPPDAVCTCQSVNDLKGVTMFLPPKYSAKEKADTSDQPSKYPGLTKNQFKESGDRPHDSRKHYMMYTPCQDVHYCVVCYDQGLFRPSRYVCCICPGQPAFCSSLNCFLEFHKNNNYQVMTAPIPARATDKFKVEAVRLL